MDSDPAGWLQDKISADLVQLHRITEVLYDGLTKYQHVRVLRSNSLGLCLVLDDKIQTSEADEFIYHEALAQTALIAHPHPQTVFIAGGGEGATLREALAHRSVERAVMVDIDAEVTALCRRYLPGHSAGAFEDPRTELHHADAREYLAKSGEKFDIIIIDLPDPIEEGPAYRLYTREFYRIARARLAGGGVISVQSGSATLTELLNLTAVNHTLQSVFPVVNVFTAAVPCFGGPWGFCLASDSLNPALLAPEEIDRRIAARGLELRFYDGTAHRGMFSLPRYLREALARNSRLISDDQPLFAYHPQGSAA